MLVEDDEIEILAIRRGFKSVELEDKLLVLKDGEEVLEYLRSEKKEKPGASRLFFIC